MASKPLGRKLNEAELNAPDLDEGVLDVETYPVPDGSNIDDPGLRAAWDEARRLIETGEIDHADAGPSE